MNYKRKTLRLDTSGIEKLLTELDSLGGNARSAAEHALKQAAYKIGGDTKRAIKKENLPAQGKYSTGVTEESIITKPEIKWDGDVASVGVGFDFDEPGAGGFLITGTKVYGTPRMKPVKELREIYKSKTYVKNLEKVMWNDVMDALKKAWGVS